MSTDTVKEQTPPSYIPSYLQHRSRTLETRDNVLETMARKSTRQSVASAPRSSSKRPAPAKTTPTRQSKRTKATSANSAYFERDSDNEENHDTEKESGYEEEAASGNASSPASESDNEVVSSEEDVKPRKKGKRGIPKEETVVAVRGKTKDKELQRPGAKLPPGVQLIIKKPKAREAGATPYADDTIHPNTMLFLKDLAANNDREWLKSETSRSCII